MLGRRSGALRPCPPARRDDAVPARPSRPFDPANLDRNVKPGDDFYHFADGTWLKNNPIPPDQTRWGSFNLLDERNKAALHPHPRRLRRRRDQGRRCRPPRAPTSRRSAISTPAAWTKPPSRPAGFQPLQPYLNEIASLKDQTALPTLVARAALRWRACAVPLLKSARTKRIPRPTSPSSARAASPAGPRLLPARRTRNPRRSAPPTWITSPRCSC